MEEEREREEEEKRWSELSKEELLDVLQHKYSVGKNCLRLGEIALRLNPSNRYKRERERERKEEGMRDQYDHFLNVANDALSSLSLSLSNQTIILCGQSGSG